MFMKSKLNTRAEKAEKRKLSFTGTGLAIVLVIVINVLAQIFETTAVYFSALLGLIAMVITNQEYLIELKIKEQLSEKTEE